MPDEEFDTDLVETTAEQPDELIAAARVRKARAATAPGSPEERRGRAPEDRSTKPVQKA
jgi:hypothetical protein